MTSSQPQREHAHPHPHRRDHHLPAQGGMQLRPDNPHEPHRIPDRHGSAQRPLPSHPAPAPVVLHEEPHGDPDLTHHQRRHLPPGSRLGGGDEPFERHLHPRRPRLRHLLARLATRDHRLASLPAGHLPHRPVRPQDAQDRHGVPGLHGRSHLTAPGTITETASSRAFGMGGHENRRDSRKRTSASSSSR